ncbi:MAG: N-acetylmuramoyl-L-alanine amidase [Desulfovibrio sp.]|jgi:N-acetylmuramoyl-L-alanine amidase|nr:N-acetylmuramoyl-L-alanine amidase [Desulfovibrio sp.]
MRVFQTLILLPAVMAGLLFAAAPLQAAAPAVRSSAPPAAGQGASAQTLIKEFDDLKRDRSRSGRRDLWIDLEERGIALRRTGSGENAAKGAYYAARAREELSLRSFLPSDRREAVALYAETAKRHAASPLAPKALYRQAELLRAFLEKPAEAAALLETLLTRYPQAEEAPKAAKLLAELKKDAPSGARPFAGQTAPAPSLTIKNILWTGKKQRGRITLELDGPARYEYEYIPPNASTTTPARIYIDIPGAFPSQKLMPSITPPDLPVSRIRLSQSSKGTRVMLDCDGVRAFAVRAPKKAPHTIRVEVSDKADITGGTKVEQDSAPDGGSGRRGKQGGGEKNAPKGNALMDQLGLTVQTIMIDAGHGGKDPGAMTGGFVEREFTLAMARRLGALLQAKGFTVLYTRAGDKYLTLQDRPDIANRKKADLFISIHLNANPNPDVRGLEVYYLDMAKTRNATLVAARENAVSVKNISDLQVILSDLVLSSKLEESRALALLVHNGILNRVRRAGFKAQDNGVRSAPFYVLMGARMPAILVECGYASNEEDARDLRSEKFLQSQAEGLIDGITAYKAKLARLTGR